MKEQAFEKVQNLSLSAFHFAVKHQAKLKKSFPKKGALRAACTASHRFHFLKWLMMRSSVTFSAANTLYVVGGVCPTTYNVFASDHQSTRGGWWLAMASQLHFLKEKNRVSLLFCYHKLNNKLMSTLKNISQPKNLYIYYNKYYNKSILAFC